MKRTVAEEIHETSQAKKEPAVEQEYYDYVQAGEYMGKTAEAIRGYVNRGMLRSTKRGGKLRFIRRAELERFCSGQ